MEVVDNARESVAGGTQEELERQCYICLDVAGAEAEEDSWVSPCLCTGTMAWVHQECLLRWIRAQERHYAPPACTRCHTRYVLATDKGVLISSLNLFYSVVVPVCKCVAGCFFAVIAFDSVCVTLGVITMTQVYGLEATLVTLMNYEGPYEAVVYLRLISLSLLLVRHQPWEDYLLRVLRKSSRLPLLGAVLPADLPLRYREPPRVKPTMRVLTDAFILPVIANVVGTLFFSSVESPLHRVLIGGAVYLTVQCGFYMYLSQKLMIRRQNIRVLPVEEAADIGEPQSGLVQNY